MGFAHYLYIINGELDLEDRLDIVDDMMGICRKALSICESLSRAHNNDANIDGIGAATSTNYYFSVLYMAYIYRQLAVAYRFAQENGLALSKEHRELCENASAKSFEMRRILFEKYDTAHVTELIRNNFEMEYFLAMAETLQYDGATDSKDRRRKCRMLKSYIEKVEHSNLLNRELIKTINNAIREAE